MPKDDSGVLPTSETIELLHDRRSIRKFTDQPVTDAEVEAVLRSAMRAPTSSNIHAYSVIVVRDKDTLAELYPVVGKQKHVLEAPVFLCFCADITRMEHAIAKHGGSMDDNPLEIGLVSSVDAALVGMTAYLTAESLGLRGVMIGAVRNDATKIAEILGMPKRVYAVFGMVLGWPDEAPKQKPRMSYDAIVHYEKYSNFRDGRDIETKLEEYDAELCAHYNAIGKETTPDSWSHDVNAKFAVPRRQQLRAQLKERGFDWR
jgi:FMN reductase (NADPH)